MPDHEQTCQGGEDGGGVICLAGVKHNEMTLAASILRIEVFFLPPGCHHSKVNNPPTSIVFHCRNRKYN
jgi:hypothetical protein